MKATFQADGGVAKPYRRATAVLCCRKRFCDDGSKCAATKEAMKLESSHFDTSLRLFVPRTITFVTKIFSPFLASSSCFVAFHPSLHSSLLLLMADIQKQCRSIPLKSLL